MFFKLQKSIKQYKGLPREIYILFIGRIINCLGSFVGPLMALILTQKFGMSSSQSGAFVALQSFLQGIGLLIGGKLVDSLGRKKVIFICQAVGGIMLISCGLTPISMFTAKMMMLSSCFYSMAYPAYDALQADVTNTKNRKIAYSLLYMGINIGFAVGPTIGGILYKKYLPFVFIGDAVTTLIAMILVVTLVKERKTELKCGKHEEERKLAERNQLEDSVEGSVFRVIFARPAIILFSMVMFFVQFTYAEWAFALPLQMGKLYGDDGARIYGMLGAINGIVVIIATPFLMRLTKKISELMNIAVSSFIYCLSFLMFGFVDSIPMFFIGVGFMTFGEIIGVTNSSTFISNNSPASHRGRISSLLSIISGTGSAISPVIIGKVIDSYGMVQGYILTAVSAVVAIVLVMIMRKIIKKQSMANSDISA